MVKSLTVGWQLATSAAARERHGPSHPRPQLAAVDLLPWAPCARYVIRTVVQ